jgi:hypothetical protein
VHSATYSVSALEDGDTETSLEEDICTSETGYACPNDANMRRRERTLNAMLSVISTRIAMLL